MSFIEESVDRTLNGAFLVIFFIGYPAEEGLDTLIILYFCPAREKECFNGHVLSQTIIKNLQSEHKIIYIGISVYEK